MAARRSATEALPRLGAQAAQELGGVLAGPTGQLHFDQAQAPAGGADDVGVEHAGRWYLGQLDGVLSAAMVYHQTESEPNKEI